MNRELYDHQPSELEEWRPVVGYLGIYEVSSLGRVRSVDHVITQLDRWGNQTARQLRGKILIPTPDNGKYSYGRLTVKLCGKGGKKAQRTRLVSSLVSEAFIGPRPLGMETAHGDGDATNNRKSNLRYATPLDNSADKRSHGTMLFGSDAPSAKLTADQVKKIRAMSASETLQRVADRFEVSIAQVSRIKSGKQWGHLA